MLINDGKYDIYLIQHQFGEKWVNSSLEYFGHPLGFTSSDECWQETGIHGTFNKSKAKRALKWISRQYPDMKFRIVCRRIMQITEPIE